MTDIEISSPIPLALDTTDALRADYEARMRKQDERIERLTLALQRPHSVSEAESVDKHYTKAFNGYLRRGDEHPLRELEQKAFQTGTTGDGGFLVNAQTATQIDTILRAASPFRSAARVVQTLSGSVDFIIDKDEFAAGWADETTLRTETATTTFDKINIKAYEITAMPKVSQRMLDDAAFDVESFIAERVSEKFSRAEGAAFINGDGVNKPFGLLSKPQVAAASWTWGRLGYLATGNATGLPAASPYDVLIDLVYALRAPHRTQASFIMNSRTAAALRKVKDTTGNYIWIDRISDATTPLLLGYPVLIVEDMPDIAANSVPIAFGNLSKAYTIVDGRDVRMLRDPYSAKPHVMFYTIKRTGGDVIDYDAIKLLKCVVA